MRDSLPTILNKFLWGKNLCIDECFPILQASNSLGSVGLSMYRNGAKCILILFLILFFLFKFVFSSVDSSLNKRNYCSFDFISKRSVFVLEIRVDVSISAKEKKALGIGLRLNSVINIATNNHGPRGSSNGDNVRWGLVAVSFTIGRGEGERMRFCVKLLFFLLIIIIIIIIILKIVTSTSL